MPEEKPAKPIGTDAAFFMLAIAFFTDVFQFMLSSIFIGAIVNPVISGITWLLFALWLKHYDISMHSGKRAVAGWATILAEIAPLADGFLFGWTAFVVYILVTNFREHSRGV